MPSSSLMPGKTNMTGFLVRTDCYCRLARELLPGQTIHIISLMLATDRRFFSSVQTFRITDAELNTAKDAPIAGSYSGVEPDGYFWSMTEVRDPPRDMLSDLAS